MSPPPPPVLVTGLSKRFKSVEAVADVSLRVDDSKFVSIVGPSGCGKSTLLRLISGLISPTSGNVFVRGVPVSKPILNVGMVFQSPVLLPWRTTVSNILFVAEMRGEAPGKYRERALELIKLAGLSGFEERRPHELSGGMQQRVAICRALLLNPSLVLMDEPFGALDVITRERMGFELEKIWNISKNTVIFVTHSISEAVLLSDSIIVMSARPGRVMRTFEVGLPRPRGRELLSHPDFVRISAEVRSCIEAAAVDEA
ncbi:MAG: ABC transporter ATP-binding protein [Terriglobia bacterium]